MYFERNLNTTTRVGINLTLRFQSTIYLYIIKPLCQLLGKHNSHFKSKHTKVRNSKTSTCISQYLFLLCQGQDSFRVQCQGQFQSSRSGLVLKVKVRVKQNCLCVNKNKISERMKPEYRIIEMCNFKVIKLRIMQHFFSI